MNKNIFMGVAILNENGEVKKALGLMKNMQTGKLNR